MARNEEKQLARLNRLYLQQQKEEELKKRPPRPKLATLSTVEDIKKWLPTIVRDIDFYIKQMEVTCYPKQQIEEFEHRVDHLRGEYKAFIRKMHQLEPDLKTTPWNDRPYTMKHRKAETDKFGESKSDKCHKDSSNMKGTEQNEQSSNLKSFIPLCTPVLKNTSLCNNWYGFEQPKVPNVAELDIQMQNEPLQFEFEKMLPAQSSQTTVAGAIEWPEKCNSFSLYEASTQMPGNVESLGEQSTHSKENCQEAKLSHNEARSNMASPLLHQSIIYNKHGESCTSKIGQMHAWTEQKGFNTGCSGKYAYDHKDLFETARDSCVSGVREDTSGVSLLGCLNIPYTDSSSSEDDT